MDLKCLECAPGYFEAIIGCFRPLPYLRKGPYLTKHDCKKTAAGRRNGCERCALLWWPKCGPAYRRKACKMCWPRGCPANTYDLGPFCLKSPIRCYGKVNGTLLMGVAVLVLVLVGLAIVYGFSTLFRYVRV